MQVKKDEVRSAILREAEKEFYNKGFIHASIRQIVKAAGTTIGNFYNYFQSKEALFEELVIDEYRSFVFFLENHDKVERPDYLWEIADVSKWRHELAKIIIKMMPVFSDRFVLLMECSEGTRFENTRKMMANLLKDHFIEHMERFGSDNTDRFLAEIIAEQVIAGIIWILKKH